MDTELNAECSAKILSALVRMIRQLNITYGRNHDRGRRETDLLG